MKPQVMYTKSELAALVGVSPQNLRKTYGHLLYDPDASEQAATAITPTGISPERANGAPRRMYYTEEEAMAFCARAGKRYDPRRVFKG